MTDALFDLRGKVAMVTGAAQGIGLGISRELVRAGSHVIIADKDERGAMVAAADITSLTSEAIALPLDVVNERSVRACVQAAIHRFSKVDILVNNAGIHCERIGQTSTIDQFTRCFDVNLFGVWRMTQELVPHFKIQGGGKIVNIASINGRKPWADTPAYSASKAALINLTQALALNLGPHRVNVNAICPGGVMTAMAEPFAQDREAFLSGLIGSRALKRPLIPEDIGCAVVFLASSHARLITGQSLNVDGGAVMN